MINIIAGGIAEAGASQAGDLAYDLKVGQLVGADPQAQLYGQALGSITGVFVSVGLYKLYTAIYEIPGPLFQIPVAHIWVLAARLALGNRLPPQAAQFASATAIIFALIIFAKRQFKDATLVRCLPGGVAFAIGKS